MSGTDTNSTQTTTMTPLETNLADIKAGIKAFLEDMEKGTGVQAAQGGGSAQSTERKKVAAMLKVMTYDEMQNFLKIQQ